VSSLSLHFTDAARIECEAGSVKRSSVCLSVPSINDNRNSGVRGFAAEHPADRRYRSTATRLLSVLRAPCSRRRRSAATCACSTELSITCGQRHVHSRRRRLNTDLIGILHSSLQCFKLLNKHTACKRLTASNNNQIIRRFDCLSK